MNDFEIINGQLYCEGVSVEAIAAQVKTPFFCYSHTTLVRHYRAFDSAFEGLDHIVCFAVKANGSLGFLASLAAEGAGADIVSGGELRRALAAGMDPGKIVYSGVGKTVEEIDLALASDILMFNVESAEELRAISARAVALDLNAPISLRINPDIDPKTHPYISTGLRNAKFGFDIDGALDRYAEARLLPKIKVVGVDCHIGSQITQVEPFIETIDRLGGLVKALREAGDNIRYFDIGGGLGITYNDEEPPHPKDYAQALREKVKALDVTLILEPGRVIAGNAGAMVTRVLYRKRQSGKIFVIVDAGMNDLIRPSLYDAFHEIRQVRPTDADPVTVDVVGPICETGDFLARDRRLPLPEQGELLAVMSAGAYGFTMSSNYNARPRAAEVLVHEKQVHVIRKRETFNDMVLTERIPAFVLRKME
jgi:diaminopimelate decarboxylase